MATLIADERRQFRLEFAWPDGSCAAIQLGRVSKREAENAKWFVEDLVASREIGTPPSAAALAWATHAPDGIRKRLNWLGLGDIAGQQRVPTLAKWLMAYIDSRPDVKPGTRVHYCKTMRELVLFFGKDIRIDRITAGQAEAFRIWMESSRRLADATVRSYCARAKLFFGAAVKQKLITENPFSGIKCGPNTNPRRFYFVTREEADAALAACPNTEWRLIFALCRYGGLRCPSEIIGLRWEDIDWAGKRFTVHSPKTERFASGGVRQVPIFPELLPHLRAAFKQARKDTEYVIIKYRKPYQNLSSYFRYRLYKAGVTPWPKLFQNLRSTRETELAEEFPLHVVCAWMGNGRLAATKHYLQVTESHYKQAICGSTSDVFATELRSALPESLARNWAALPKQVRESILTLAATASRVRF